MKNIGASIRARLLNKAHADGEDFTYLLLRYAMERLLFRIGASRQFPLTRRYVVTP